MPQCPLFHLHFPDLSDEWAIAHSGGAHTVFTPDLPGGFTSPVSGVWSQQAYVKACNSEANDEFGTSVALSGDTLAVGASREDSSADGIGGNQTDNGCNFAGAVYVYVAP